jgi:DNA-binding NtrC family response regulator
VDDDAEVRDALSMILEDTYDVTVVSDGFEALERMGKRRPDLVLLDIMMPEISGFETLERIKSIDSSQSVIIISGVDKAGEAVRAIKEGALDYITKPFEKDVILEKVGEAISRSRPSLSPGRPSHPAFDNIIAQSDKMVEVLNQVQQLDTSKSTVLITGETGTGKELIARALHEVSRRSDQPFEAVNCAAFTRELFESELFGHVKGAFTNAINDKPGKFQLAREGTLFLDEVGEMDMGLQAKILRALQERVIVRVGGTQEIRVHARLIAATNRDLVKEVEEGRFREDLYYRLNVIPLHLPPLRERKGDVELLAEVLVKRLADDMHKPITGLSQEVLVALKRYRWPGNVRELVNVLERAVALADGRKTRLEMEDFGQMFQRQKAAGSTTRLAEALREFEIDLLRQVLERNDYNIMLTAQELGIHRNSVHNKVRQYDIKLKRQGDKG